MAKSSWQRPRTTRRYLHPPRAERMFTLWAEGKILFGENEKGVDAGSYAALESVAVWLFHSRNAAKYCTPFKYDEVTNIQPADGTPVHAVQHEYGGFDVTLEAFCNITRKPTCFFQVRVKNNAPYRAKHAVGLAVRRGKEKSLAFGSPDGYISYDPELSDFLRHVPTFSVQNGILRDGEYFLTYDESIATYDAEKGVLWLSLSLDAGEELVATFSLAKGEVCAFDYEDEKKKAVTFWHGELTKLNKLPNGIRNHPDRVRTVQNLTVQILQNFCYFKGEEELVLRQGGLQRLIWPWDAKPALEALGAIGDYDAYLDEVISFYFDKMQLPDGEIDTVGEHWASVTVCSLYSLATRCMQKSDPLYWKRYRDKAFLTFAWVKAQRRAPREADAVAGIFPPKRGCDNPTVFQHWTNTDVWALFALKQLAVAAEHFGDAEAQAVWQEYRDYRARVQEIFSRFVKEAEGSDELRIPLTPSGNDKPFLDNFHPYLLQGVFAYEVIDEPALLYKARNWLVNHGLAQNGLHARQPYRDGNMHIFYTTVSDSYWYRIYRKLGERERARETFEAMQKYSMTDEYYMIERYADNDPYYVPWSPNASANGRFILMMLDHYKE